MKRGDGHCFQQSQVCLSSFIRGLHQHMMQCSEASFASAAALTGAERHKRICKALLKRAFQVENSIRQCMQQSERWLSSFCLCHHEPLMQDTEGSFASTAALTGAERHKRICKALLKRACQVETRRWPLLPAESGLPVKLHQGSSSTYDAMFRSKLCVRSSSDGR